LSLGLHREKVPGKVIVGPRAGQGLSVWENGVERHKGPPFMGQKKKRGKIWSWFYIRKKNIIRTMKAWGSHRHNGLLERNGESPAMRIKEIIFTGGRDKSTTSQKRYVTKPRDRGGGGEKKRGGERKEKKIDGGALIKKKGVKTKTHTLHVCAQQKGVKRGKEGG